MQSRISPFAFPLLFGTLLTLLGGCQTPPPTAGPEEPAEAPVAAGAIDVEHYAIELALHPRERRIEGLCRVRLYPAAGPVSEVALDFAGLQVRGVKDETGRALAFTHEGERLAITLAAPLAPGAYTELAIAYGGRPRLGLWFSGEREDGGVPTQVFSHGQSKNNRGWFPCVDDPADRATSEVRVTMPPGWVSMAAGERIERQEEPDRVVEHWRMSMPHPSFLVTLVAGEFMVRESVWDGTPLYVVAEARYEKLLEASFHETDEILAFLSEYTGYRYPYPKYSQTVVANFPWNGMENISATTLTPLTLDGERGHRDESSYPLVAHEAAHQWFGNLVSCRDWSHLWLSEGFATYLSLLYTEHSRGTDEFRARMRDTQMIDLYYNRGENRQPTVWDGWKEADDLLSPHRYQGGASRLHLLRFLLGEEAFRAAVCTFVAENAERGVVTDDFRRAAEKVSGRDLGEFFDQWIYGAGHPELELSWEWHDRTQTVRLEVRQVQEARRGTAEAFRFPVEVELLEDAGTRVHRIEITQRRQTFPLAADGKPHYVRFDRHGWVPKAMRWSRDPAEWLAIAHQDQDVNGRRYAVDALGRLAGQARTGENLAAHETYVAEIVGRMRHDSSEHVRADAARSLAHAGGLEARERLMEIAQKDASAKVRVATLEALAHWGEDKRIAELARASFDQGYSWATMGAAAGLVCSSDPHGAYAWITARLLVDSPHDQLRGYLFEHLGSLGNEAATGQLLRWAKDESVHPSARAIALRQLPRRQRNRVTNQREAAAFLSSSNFRLRQAAVETLVEFDTRGAKEALREYYPRAVTARERRAIEAAVDSLR